MKRLEPIEYLRSQTKKKTVEFMSAAFLAQKRSEK
jgi:hypothetical protein